MQPPSFIKKLGTLEGAPNWSSTAGRVTDFTVRSGCAVLTQLHVISPVHAELGLNLTALENAATARGVAFGAAAVYAVLKNGYDILVSMEDSLPSAEPPQVEYRPEEIPAPAAR